MAARAASVAAADPRPELSAASREYREHGRHASRVLLSHGCKSELRAWEDCLSFVSMKKGRVSTDGLGQHLAWVVGVERCSCLYGLLVGRIRRNWNVRSGAHVQRGRSCRQTKSGASGSELLVAGKHVPDRVGEPAGDVDLGDLGAALLAEPALVALVALRVGGVLERVHGRLEQRPAQVGGAVLGQRAAAILVA